MEEERLQILRMLEAGQIGAAEADALLAALETETTETHEPMGGEEPAQIGGEQATARARPEPAPPDWDTPRVAWSRYWIYPLMAGGGILLLGALIMGLLYSTGAARGWRVCGWVPMIGGLIVVGLAWWSRTARWFHLRIREHGRRTMALSFPVPLALAVWGLRIARPFVPQLQDTSVDEVIVALRDSVGRGEPFFMDVEDDEDGEQVQLYLG